VRRCRGDGDLGDQGGAGETLRRSGIRSRLLYSAKCGSSSWRTTPACPSCSRGLSASTPTPSM
jgi:hypothetical protein